MDREKLVEALVRLGFNRDALKSISTDSLRIVLACHK